MVERGNWGSKLGFILAAAGSAVGLGNIWKFPYVTGENGGGWFVLIYLICVVVVGLPIMIAEVLIGRETQRSPVGAFRALSSPRSPWAAFGWLSLLAAFVILSYYSVVAGWTLHYVWLSLSGGFDGDASAIADRFGALYADSTLNVVWHVVFMAMTIAIVIGGVKKGVERWSSILMPLLFVMMVILLVQAATMDGFGKAVDFVFAPHSEKLTPSSVLEALGQAFFSLSLGMGAMLTYGSYLKKDEDIVSSSIYITLADTSVALLACLILFPITFTFGMEAAGGPGLVFKNMPIALAQMPGAVVFGPLFFLLLTFAALTSAISLLEVAAAYFIDERGWSRNKATIVTGVVILLGGIPAALSGSTELFGKDFSELFGLNWFDSFDYLASNWMLPLGGLAIALFVSWRVGGEARRRGFESGSSLARLYWAWLTLLRYLVPIGVTAVFLNATGVLDAVLG